MNNRYDTNNKGLAPAMSDILAEYGKSPRTPFNRNRRRSFDVSPFAIVPFHLISLLPNTDVYCKYDIQVINKNPTIRRMLGSARLEVRSYAINNSDCWEGHNNFVTCGRSGKIAKSIPTISFNPGYIVDEQTSSNLSLTSCLPYNPYFYMGICPPRYFAQSTEAEPYRAFSFESNRGLQLVSNCQDSGLTGLVSVNKSVDEISAYNVSALPGVFYTKVVKEFQNPNLLQDNPYWYPENENHDLILPYDIPKVDGVEQKVTCSVYDNCTLQFGSGNGDTLINSISPTNDKHSAPFLNVLYNCRRRGTRINTGSPFPNLLRGDVPTLSILNAKIDRDSLNNYLQNTHIDTSKIIGTNGSGGLFNLLLHTPQEGNPDLVVASSHNGDQYDLTQTGNLALLLSTQAGLNPPNNTVPLPIVTDISLALSNFRALTVQTIFREKMARTDGSYNQMIEAQFGINPRWHNHEPVYLGSSVQPIVFSEVTQTSSDSDSPLGTTAGRFVSASQNDEVRYHSNDFGMLMSVLCIVPDDYYCQGVQRLWSSLLNSDIPFPIFNNLDPEAVLNKELYISGTDNVDNDVFNYQERYSSYKSCENEIAGLLALPISKVGDVGAFFFNRLLGSTPNFNHSFCEGRFTDNENLCFSSTEQAQFICSIGITENTTYPLPMTSRPTDMGISFA